MSPRDPNSVIHGLQFSISVRLARLATNAANSANANASKSWTVQPVGLIITVSTRLWPKLL